MLSPLRLAWRLALPLLALGAVILGMVLRGGEMFSPGALSARHPRGVPRGGVGSHAEVKGNCSACHSAPWNGDTMADRCLNCHSDIRDQIAARLSLHGKLPGVMRCRSCHTEHTGEHATLISLAGFDHAWTGFHLTGRHQGTECKACHTGESYRGTPHTCSSCHAEPKAHQGRFGTDCARCHSTETWGGATFRHRFPLNHGRRGTLTCATCHTSATDFRTWTCYGCHEHSQRKIESKHLKKRIVDFQNCARCHSGGRKHDRGKWEGGREFREWMKDGRKRKRERRDD
jgi:Class III cytochrome C family